MNTLNGEDLVQVSGGLVGGGLTRSGIPMYDASETHAPGQNSYGETIPGGADFYYGVLSAGERQIAQDAAVSLQANACATGNALACVIATVNALNAIEANTERTPYVKGPQGK